MLAKISVESKKRDSWQRPVDQRMRGGGVLRYEIINGGRK